MRWVFLLAACSDSATINGAADLSVPFDLQYFDGEHFDSEIIDLAQPPAVTPGCPPLTAASGHMVEVADVAALLAAANGAQANDVILVDDGTYTLSGGAYLYITQPGVSLRGKSGDREKVIIDGNYQQGPTGQSLVTIAASNVTLADLTVQRAYDHPIHVDASAADLTGTVIYNVHVKDPGQQGIKVNGPEPGFAHSADSGTIACSHVELTAAGRPHIRDNCYTGGIDAHAGRGWQVRDNLIDGFWCAAGLSEHGIHFWKGARDTVIERNVIRDCARGIGLGLGDATDGRTYGDDPCPGVANVGQFGGSVCNNFIAAADAQLFASASGFDSGISLEKACGTTLLHNSVASTTAPLSSSIEWRWSGTSVTLTNNLATGKLQARDGATATQNGNLMNAAQSLFSDIAAGDLHLTGAVPAGVAITTCDHDIDGEPRDLQMPDVGADERP